MSAGSGPPSREPFARYDRASCSWRTFQPSLFEDLPESPPTWPKSGTWDLGAAYERPMSAPATAGSASSSPPGLLPTPAAGNFNDGESLESWEARRQRNLAKGINGNGQGTPLAIAAQQLLPTPAARDWKSGQSNIMDRNARPLNEVVEMLLPTPRTGDNRNSRVALTGANADRHGRTAKGSASGIGLEQAIELAQGIVPRELLGEPMSPPSAAGKPPPAAQRPRQLSLDELDSD